MKNALGLVSGMDKGKQSHNSKADRLFARASQQWELSKLQSAFRLFLAAAKSGDSGAQHNLGYFYDVGIGVKPNRTAALRWYRKAYRHGSRTAASNIATIFRDSHDTVRALSWLKRAAHLGDADANLEIAKIHAQNGRTKLALDYLKRTVNADGSDVTKASREEVQLLIKQFQKHRSNVVR